MVNFYNRILYYRYTKVNCRHMYQLGGLDSIDGQRKSQKYIKANKVLHMDISVSGKITKKKNEKNSEQ